MKSEFEKARDAAIERLIGRYHSFGEKDAFNAGADWAYERCQKNSFAGKKENGLLIKLERQSEMLKVAREALEIINWLGAFEIKFDPPAKPGKDLFSIIDKQRQALTKLEEMERGE